MILLGVKLHETPPREKREDDFGWNFAERCVCRDCQAKPRPKPRPRPRKRTPEEIEEIFRRFHAVEPEPKGELEHSNPFTLLVAVVLSAQATDAGVNKATRGLFELADTPEKMLALGEDKVRDLIKTIGLFRNKAKNVILLSKKAHCRTRGWGSGRSRHSAVASRRRPKDGQRGDEHGLRPCDDGG